MSTPVPSSSQEQTNESTSVGLDFPKQQARVREVLSEYKAIGPAGMFGALMIEGALQRADQAMASGDIVAILRSYQELKEIES